MALPPAAPNTGTLLLYAYRLFERDLFASFRSAGHAAVRPKHGAVLANIGPEGTRLTDLAVAAGMTKPSMKELIDELIELGYVFRNEDPADKRARRINLTPQGAELAALAFRSIEKMERRYEEALGERLYGSLRKALLLLVEESARTETKGDVSR